MINSTDTTKAATGESSASLNVESKLELFPPDSSYLPAGEEEDEDGELSDAGYHAGEEPGSQ